MSSSPSSASPPPGDPSPEGGEHVAAKTPSGEAAQTIVDIATSGRARCRACKKPLAKGTTRFGQVLNNPFNEKPTTYWFHLSCAALRRSGAALKDLRSIPDLAPELVTAAELGAAYPRLERACRRELAPTGRARCRACRELIDKGSWRFALEIFDGGRFMPMGYVHEACQIAYFGVAVDAQRLQLTDAGD